MSFNVIVNKTEKGPLSVQESQGRGDGMVGLTYNWMGEHTQRVCLALSCSLSNQSLG